MIKTLSKNLKKVSILYIVLFAAFLFGAFAKPANAAVHELKGYAWSDGIGWISMNCTNHEVPDVIGGPPCGTPYHVEYDDVSGNLTGYAWSDNAGWLSFNTSAPFTYASPSNPAQPPQIAGTTTKYTRGWARFCTPLQFSAPTMFDPDASCAGNPILSIINGLFLGGWDGWVSLTGSSPSYGATLNTATGYFTGYWWGGNEHVGWINVDQVKIDGTNPDLQLRLVHSIKIGSGPTTFSPPSAFTTNTTVPSVTTPLSGMQVNMTVPATITIAGVNHTSFLQVEYDTTNLTGWSCVGTNFVPAFNQNTDPTGAITISLDGVHVAPAPGTVLINNNTASSRRGYSMTCTQGANSITKTLVYDVLPNQAVVSLTATPNTFTTPTGWNTTLSWYGANVTNCVASVDPATSSPGLVLTAGGVPGWNSIINPNPVGTFASPKTTPVALPFSPPSSIVAIDFKIYCDSTINGADHPSSKAMVTYENNQQDISFSATSVGGTQVWGNVLGIGASTILNVNPGEKIQLDWQDTGSLFGSPHDWTSCTASLGENKGSYQWASPASPFNTPFMKAPNATNGYAQSTGGKNVSIPSPGSTKPYKITCTDGLNTVSKILNVKVASLGAPILKIYDSGSYINSKNLPLGTTDIDLAWSQPAGSNFVNCKGVTTSSPPPSGWVGTGLSPNPPTQPSYSAPPKTNVINPNVGDVTKFKIECDPASGGAPIESNEVIVTIFDNTGAGSASLACTDPGIGWDGTVGDKDFTFIVSNIDNCEIQYTNNGAGGTQPKIDGPYTSSGNSTLSLDPVPQTVKLVCLDNSVPQKTIASSVVVQPNGSCTAGPKGGIKPRWIEF